MATKEDGSSWPEQDIIDEWIKKSWVCIDDERDVMELKKVVSEPRIAAEKLAEKYREELGEMETRALSAEAALEPAVGVLQKRIDSIARMMGWPTTPTHDMLEDNIRAMKERLGLAEDERAELRRDFKTSRDTGASLVQERARMLNLPQLPKSSRYCEGAITRGIKKLLSTLRFYENQDNWKRQEEGDLTSPFVEDCGRAARASLSGAWYQEGADEEGTGDGGNAR